MIKSITRCVKKYHGSILIQITDKNKFIHLHKKPVHYYIISGEASGDLHASNLIKELKRLDSNAVFTGWGGDLMIEQGVGLVKHIRDFSYMGFVEVLSHLKSILADIRFCKNHILQVKPDAIILVDFPGFNLRIAAFAKEQGIPVIYYISPQIWAWKQSRIKKIKASVDKMMVILPFEKEFYNKFDYNVDFVGHPLLDAIENYKTQHSFTDFRKKNRLDDKPIIALLPGSRQQEIKKMLHIMCSVVGDFKQFQFVIAGAPSIAPDYYKALNLPPQVHCVFGQTYDLLLNSDAALVTSGTATLETALFNVPEVVCYKGSYISYWLAKKLIKVSYISLVNLILNRKAVEELIQHDLNHDLLIRNLRKITEDQKEIETMKNSFEDLRQILGGPGASGKAAESVVNFLKGLQNKEQHEN
jgi:lipid-A-disaccharide synthase